MGASAGPHGNAPPNVTADTPHSFLIDRWHPIKVALAGGAGFGLGYLIYPTIFQRPDGIAFWGAWKWALTIVATLIVTFLSHFFLQPHLSQRQDAAAIRSGRTRRFGSRGVVSLGLVILVATIERVLHVLFEDTSAIVTWIGGFIGASAVTYVWILAAYVPSLSLPRLGAIASASAIPLVLAQVAVLAVNRLHIAPISSLYWSALVVNYAIRFGILAMIGRLAIRGRWAGHPGIRILLSLSAVAVVTFIGETQLPRNLVGDPLLPPRQGLIGEFFMFLGWGLALALYPDSGGVFLGKVRDPWLPGRSWIESFARRTPRGTIDFGHRFVYGWTVSSSIAWLLAFYFAINSLSLSRVRTHTLFAFAYDLPVLFGVAGSAIGGIQWLFLRNVFSGSGWWWVAGNGLGYCCATLFLVLLPRAIWAVPVAALTPGLIAGSLQLPLLRNNIPQAWRWLAISSVAFCARAIVEFLIPRLGLAKLLSLMTGFYGVETLGVASLAAITGAGLVRLCGRKFSVALPRHRGGSSS